MPIFTRRWDDPPESTELAQQPPPTRILVTRYRPRGLPKERETWDQWTPNLGPSQALHAAAYGKTGAPIGWPIYRARYLAEMLKQQDAIKALAQRIANGESITLLCSSQCVRESRCHRSLLRELIESHLKPPPSPV